VTKKLLSKNSFFASFLKITFYWFTFSQFHLQIWNKHKILRFLIPILTYLRKKNFGCILKKIFSVKIGQKWVPKCAEFYSHSKSEDEIEKNCTNKLLFKKN